MPSSSHASSNSLVATMPYQYWWPNSCSIGEFGDVGGFVPGGVAGEEGGVLHAAHLGAGFGVDDGDDLVGIGAVALVELGEGLLQDVEVAGAGFGVGSEGEDVDLYGAERGEVGAVGDGEVGAGGPGEVADVFAVKAEGFGVFLAGSGGVDDFAGGDAAGSDDVAAGKGEADVEGGEVGEELGGGVVLMAVPGAVPEDAGFGIPLASHDEVALVAVAGDRERELIVKGDVEGDGVVGSERVGESDFGYGVVLLRCRRRER